MLGSITLHFMYHLVRISVTFCSKHFHPVYIRWPSAVNAKCRNACIIGYPNISVWQTIDVAWFHSNIIFPVYSLTDIEVTTLAGIVEKHFTIVCTQPHIILPVGIHFSNTIGSQSIIVTPTVAGKGSELVAVITTQAIPCGYPHQAIRVLCHARNTVSCQSITNAKSTLLDFQWLRLRHYRQQRSH